MDLLWPPLQYKHDYEQERKRVEELEALLYRKKSTMSECGLTSEVSECSDPPSIGELERPFDHDAAEQDLQQMVQVDVGWR